MSHSSTRPALVAAVAGSLALGSLLTGAPPAAAAPPGARNTGVHHAGPSFAWPAQLPACEGTDGVPIGSVQGAGPQTPVPGAVVTVRGTVVADLQDGGLDGFHVQDAGDADPATSDGVFVHAPAGAPVDLGDRVAVVGTVAEQFGQTQLGTVSYADCGTGTAPAPAELSLPAPDAAREALEGMAVTVPAALTVTDVFGLDTYGEVQLASGGRLLSATEAAETGAPAAAVQAENATRSVLVDDGRSTDLAAAGQAPPYLAPGEPVRVGDTAELQPVVLGYGFDAWRLQPADGTAEGTSFAPTNPRPTAPPAVGGDLRIADFNVLNYFVDFPSEFGDLARGAANAAELAQQQEKIVSAITALDADVITLHEIENSAVLTPATPYRAVETLLAAISARSGVDTWAYAPAAEDTDVITNAIVYRTDRVTAVGAPAVPADLSAFGNARSPIAQTFRAGGEVFTVVSNHLKSKGSGCGAGSDQPDPRGGNCNGDRVAQATALVAFAGQLATATGDPDVLLTGDFNAYRYEDPIDVVTAAGYTDMAPVLAPGQYSYVFRGGSGSLDHVLASASMAPKLTGLGVWDVNAVESRGYQYDGSEALFAPDPFRASDHDPVLVGIDTDTPAQAVLDPAAPERGRQVTVTGTGFAAGEQVVASLPDEPSADQRDVGSGVADVSGRVAITLTVPDANRKGEREVRLTGAGGETASTSYTVR